MMMMKTTKMSALDQIKEEFCSRYNLTPEQISFAVDIKGVEKDLANQIALDYSPKEIYAVLGEKLSMGHTGDLWVTAHHKQEEEEA
jgi:hypothetical protein